MSSSSEPDEDLRDVFKLLYADEKEEDWAFSDDEEVG
jgi:site-specific recombinase